MAEAFQQDLTCSICLDLFVEPVLLSCEHCFCKKCILSFWDSQERASSCPECRAPCPDRQCTPSRLLRNLAKRAWDMRHEPNSGTLPNTTEVSDKEEREVEREEGQNKVLCEVHGESSELFCTIDEIPICSRCINSSVHSGHSFISLKDGVQSCKIKLAKALEPLEIRIKKLEELEGSQQEKIYSLKDVAASLRTNTEAIFSKLHQILYQRQAEMLAELDKDEKDAHKDMADHLEQIQEKLSAVKEVVTEGKSFMALKNLSSFLLGVRPFLEKLPAKKATHCEEHKDGLKVLYKKLTMGKFKGPIQHLACRPLFPLFAQGLQPVQLDCNTAHPLLKIMNKETRVIPSLDNMHFIQRREYMKNQCWTVFAKNGFLSELEPVQLDLDTAHPIFTVVDKGMHLMIQVQRQKYWNDPQRFQGYQAVCGGNGFTAGKHYWEVETEDITAWFIGLTIDSIAKKTQIGPECWKDNIWAIELARVEGISPKATS